MPSVLYNTPVLIPSLSPAHLATVSLGNVANQFTSTSSPPAISTLLNRRSLTHSSSVSLRWREYVVGQLTSELELPLASPFSTSFEKYAPRSRISQSYISTGSMTR